MNGPHNFLHLTTLQINSPITDVGLNELTDLQKLTTVYLLGGENTSEAQIFRKEVKWGESTFTVPLTPGRTLHLTVQVQGGREGWEAIGSVVIPATANPTVTIGLSDAGAHLSAQ